MPLMIFVNLPVSDVPRATAFYAALGARQNHDFSDLNGSFMAFSDAINVMLLSHGKFAGFTPRAIADVRQASSAIHTLSAESREAVDRFVERAVAAGGRADPSPVDDHGFMYGRSIEDPDGHLWGICWLDVDAAVAAMRQAAPQA